MEPDDLSSIFTPLIDDLETLRPRLRRSAAAQSLTHTIIDRIYQVDFTELADDQKIGLLVQNVAEARAPLAEFLAWRDIDDPSKVEDYLKNLAEWTMSLAGDPTTPPPVYGATVAQ